ncbi:MAG: carotenoid biosynthesis protein [Microthrixaceae bacterium]
MEELVGTLLGRWYVTLFGITFAVTAIRHMGWRKTVVYAVAATAVGVLAENAAVHWGVPYTRYSFNESLRGEELWILDVPLMVSLSYTFMGYFAFATARLVAGGPWRTRGRTPVLEFLVAVMLSTWALWVVDPVSRLGEHFFLGQLFAYDGPGFWFGLPLGSQLGFTTTSVVLVGILTLLMRDEPSEPVSAAIAHPHWPAVGGYLGQIIFMAATAFVVARQTANPAVRESADALAGSAVIIYVPILLLVALGWRAMAVEREQSGAGEVGLGELGAEVGSNGLAKPREDHAHG